MDASKEIVKLFKDQNKELLIQLSKEFQLDSKAMLRKYHTSRYYMPVTHISSVK